MKWEVFLDESYFSMWCVRPMGDKNFNSPQSFHFSLKEDAEKLKELAEKAVCSEKDIPKSNWPVGEHIREAFQIMKKANSL